MTKAAELLAQARAALGGDSEAGEGAGALGRPAPTSARLGDRQLSGEITIDFAAAGQDGADRQHEPDR